MVERKRKEGATRMSSTKVLSSPLKKKTVGRGENLRPNKSRGGGTRGGRSFWRLSCTKERRLDLKTTKKRESIEKKIRKSGKESSLLEKRPHSGRKKKTSGGGSNPGEFQEGWTLLNLKRLRKKSRRDKGKEGGEKIKRKTRRQFRRKFSFP